MGRNGLDWGQTSSKHIIITVELTDTLLIAKSLGPRTSRSSQPSFIIGLYLALEHSVLEFIYAKYSV